MVDTLGVLHARCSPSPGALDDLCGASVLGRIVERLRRATLLSDLVVITSGEPTDQGVFHECARLGVKVWSHPSPETVSGIASVARSFSPWAVVRFSSRTPLIDPVWTDLCIQELFAHGHDYVTAPDLPPGVAPECFTMRVLEKARMAPALTDGLSPIPPVIRKHPELFNAGLLQAPARHRARGLRFIVETHDDASRMQAIYERFFGPGRIVVFEDVLTWLRQNGNAPPLEPAVPTPSRKRSVPLEPASPVA